jgi:hypothetical protein
MIDQLPPTTHVLRRTSYDYGGQTFNNYVLCGMQAFTNIWRASLEYYMACTLLLFKMYDWECHTQLTH